MNDPESSCVERRKKMETEIPRRGIPQAEGNFLADLTFSARVTVLVLEANQPPNICRGQGRVSSNSMHCHSGPHSIPVTSNKSACFLCYLDICKWAQSALVIPVRPFSIGLVLRPPRRNTRTLYVVACPACVWQFTNRSGVLLHLRSGKVRCCREKNSSFGQEKGA